MAITLSRFQTIFKRLSKLIYVDQLIDPVVTNLKSASVGLMDQLASGQPSEFDAIQDVGVPIGHQTKGTVLALQLLPNACKSALSVYLTRYVGVEMGLPINSSLANVGSELIDQMGNVSALVQEDGIIFNYFITTFGIELPANGSPTIPDDWVCAEPVDD